MPMNVATKRYFALLFGLLDKHFCVIDWGMGLFRWLNPLAVKVGAWQVAAVVTDYDTVDVEHGDDLEYEVFSKHTSGGAVSDEEVNYVLDDETWHCLSWVNSSCQYYRLFLLIWRLPYG